MAQNSITLLRAYDIQNALDCSRKKVYRLFKTNEFPGFKIQGTWYVRADEFDTWLKQTSRGKKQAKK